MGFIVLPAMDPLSICIWGWITIWAGTCTLFIQWAICPVPWCATTIWDILTNRIWICIFIFSTCTCITSWDTFRRGVISIISAVTEIVTLRYTTLLCCWHALSMSSWCNVGNCARTRCDTIVNTTSLRRTITFPNFITILCIYLCACTNKWQEHRFDLRHTAIHLAAIIRTNTSLCITICIVYTVLCFFFCTSFWTGLKD